MISLKGNKKFVVHLFILCLLLVTGIFTSAPVYGLNSHSEATLDWSGLTITPDPGMTIIGPNIWDSQSWAVAMNNSANDSEIQSLPGGSDTSATAGVTGPGSVTGNAFTNNATISASTDAVLGCCTDYDATSGAGRSVYFGVLGSGNIAISIPYSLSTDQYSVAAGEFNIAGARTMVGFLNTTGGTEDRAFNFIDSAFLGPGVFLDSRSGTLSTMLYFSSGDSGVFNAFIDTHNGGTVAPEPISMVLVGVGMLGLPFVRRFRGFKGSSGNRVR